MDGGRVRAQGTYEGLLAQNEDFAQLMLTHTSTNEKHAESEDTDEESIKAIDVNEKKLAKVETTKSAVALMQDEERATKAVSGEVYGTYLTAGGSVLVAPFVVTMLAISQGANILTSLWLSWWVSSKFSLGVGEWVSCHFVPT